MSPRTPMYRLTLPMVTPSTTPTPDRVKLAAILKLEVNRFTNDGKPLLTVDRTVSVTKSTTISPRVPQISTRLVSGDVQSESDTSPIAESDGINTRISSTAASRTRPRLKPTPFGPPGLLRKWHATYRECVIRLSKIPQSYV